MSDEYILNFLWLLSQSCLSCLSSIQEPKCTFDHKCLFALIESHVPSVPASLEGKEGEKSAPPMEATQHVPVDLVTAIAQLTSHEAYSTATLPPRLPSPFKRWTPKLAPDVPHDPNAYFPMILYK